MSETRIPIVDAALREKACEMAMGKLGYIGPWDELAALHRGRIGATVDAVLSTVLGKVRVAKEVGVLEWSGKGDALRLHLRSDGGVTSSVYESDSIAILEEAGKEGDE